MKAKQIGIIGAGPAGLAALKTALETPEYRSGKWADPVVLEAREDVGGVWLPAPASFSEPRTSPATAAADSTSPSTKSYFEAHCPSECQMQYPPTPLYDSLTTNLPHPVMAFSSFAFPTSTPLFPKASIVQSYLAAYADQVVGNADAPRRMREYVKTRRRVTSVRWASESGSSNGGGDADGNRGGGGVWEVESQAGEGTEAPRVERYAFDLLLICTGHYSTPNYPSEDEMPGLGAWREAGRAAHAIWYRNAESIPVPAGDDYDAFQRDGKRNKSTIGGETVDDAPTRDVPPDQAKNRGQEDSDTRFGEVYEKAVADAQTSERVPHLHPQYGQSSDTRIGNSVSNPSLAQKPRLSHATVLIVGTGPSGTDIAADLVRAGVRRVIIASSATPSTSTTPVGSFTSSSTPTPTSSASVHTPAVLAKPLPVRFHLHDTKPTGKVTFADDTAEDSITFVVLATGYQVDFPFFNQSPIPTPTSNTTTGTGVSIAQEKFRLPKGVLPAPFWSGDDGESFIERGKFLTNSNICVFPLARHLFPLPGFYSGANLGSKNRMGSTQAPHPTSLAFLGLNVRVAPLPLVEAQARAALNAFAYCSSPEAPQTRNDSDKVEMNYLDWEAEENAIRERWDMLAVQYDESSGSRRAAQEGEEVENNNLLKRRFIAKIWHRLPEDEQFAYRDDLDRFAFGLGHPSPNSHSHSQNSSSTDGTTGPHKTREWESRVYAQKGVLRSAWRALEARGDGSAEEWVSGVGSGKTGRRKRKGPGDEGGDAMNGEEEWVDMMVRLVVWWETEGRKEDEERIAMAT